MSNFAPPTTVCFSAKQQDDELSRLSQPCFSDEYPSQPDDLGIELGADPYFYYTLDKIQSKKNKTEKEELMELRVQVARQQEKMSKLGSKLSHVLTENEQLKATGSTMAKQLASSIQGRRRRSCEDTSCQQVINNVTRKSFQTFIKESRRRSSVDEGMIEKLKQENKSLKQHLMGSTVPEKVNVRPLLRQSTTRTSDETEVESSYRRSCGSDQSSWLIREVKEHNDAEVEDLGKDLATKLFLVRGKKSARIAGIDVKDTSLFSC